MRGLDTSGGLDTSSLTLEVELLSTMLSCKRSGAVWTDLADHKLTVFRGELWSKD